MMVFSLSFVSCKSTTLVDTITGVDVVTKRHSDFLVEKVRKVNIYCPDVTGSASSILLGHSKQKTYFLTAAHVAKILVLNPLCFGTVGDKSSTNTVKVEYVSKDDDLAIISSNILILKNIVPVTIASSHYIGQSVTSVGFQVIDMLEGDKEVSHGISISYGLLATEVFNKSTGALKLIRVTAQSFSGNSGGGIFNSRGELLGVMSFGKVTILETGIIPHEGQAFAVPYNRVVQAIKKSGIKF